MRSHSSQSSQLGNIKRSFGTARICCWKADRDVSFDKLRQIKTDCRTTLEDLAVHPRKNAIE